MASDRRRRLPDRGDEQRADGIELNTNTYDTVRSINTSGTWEVTANYSLGWSGVGNWMNYTRDIPANTYQVWAGMSSDRGAVADGLVASLSRVVGSASVSNQVVEAIGTFQSAGTRGWGNTALVPLRNASQEVVEVAFSGLTTLRVDMNYGDVDYLMLIPTGGPCRRGLRRSWSIRTGASR